MPKIPRNINGRKLCKSLMKYGYEITRQTGSHIRMSRVGENSEHHITIPDHRPIKIGTLNKILSDVATHLNISKNQLIDSL